MLISLNVFICVIHVGQEDLKCVPLLFLIRSMSADNLPEDFYDVTPEDIAHAKRHEEARKHVRSVGGIKIVLSWFRLGMIGGRI